MGSELGRAALELVTDDSKLYAGIDKGEKAAVALVASFDKAAKGISSSLGQTSQVVEEFQREITAAFTSVDVGSRGVSAAMQKLIGADVIERANAYAKAVTGIGGVSKLTAAEQQNLLVSVNAATQKYTALGITAPKALTDLSTATKAAVSSTQALEKEAAAIQAQFNRFSGEKVVDDAHAMAAAVQQLGGASKLTAGEQAQVNRTAQEAIDKYKTLGQTAPAALHDLVAATTPAGAATSKLTGFMGDLGSQVKATALGFIGAQAVIGAVQSGFQSFVGFVSGSISAYAEQETAVKKLTTALQAQGQVTPEVVSGYQDMAAEFQRTTVFSDELINEMQALLVEIGDVGPAQMDKALTAATDLSAGLGIDLRTATTLVGKAFAGETGTLKRYGIVIDEAKLKTEGASAVLDAIQAKFGGQAQAEVETYAGKVKQLANAWNEVQEAVGKSIVTDPIVIGLLRELHDAVVGVSDEAGTATGTWTEWWASVVGGESARLAVVSLSTVLGLVQSAEASLARANALAKAAAPADPFKGGFGETNGSGIIGASTTQFLEDYAAGMEAASEADTKAAKDAEAHAKAVRSLMDAYSGANAIKAALDATAAFNRNVQAGIGLSKMSREQQDQLNKTLETGVQTYKALGREAPKSLIAAYTETFRLDRLLDEFEPKLTPIASGLQGIGQAIETGVVPPIQAWQRIMDPLLKDLDKLPANLLQATAIAGPSFDSVRVRAERAGGAITEVGRGIQDMGRLIPGFAGQATESFGSIVSAVGGLQNAFEQAAKSQHAFAIEAVASAGFVLGAYQQLVGIVDKLAGDLGAGEFFAAVNARGGRLGVQTSGITAGFNTQILLTTRNAESFRGQLDRFDRAVKASNDRLERYGLTWMDLGDHIQQANIDQMTRDLVADFRALGNAGVDATKRISVMSGGLSQLVVDAVATGQKIPVALQPMLDTLIRSGKLSDAAAKALLGIADDGVPAFKDIEDAAKRYGIEVDKLGPKVKQLKIDDIAAQIIKDWTLLQSAGADTNTVLVGMQKSVQDVVTEALKAGLKIPEGMKPIIEAMARAGLLTDEFGNKLDDTSKIEFEKPITAAIEDLISALDRLINKLSGVGDEAIRTRGELEKIGDAVPRGSAGTGTGTGSGSGTGTGGGTAAPTGTLDLPPLSPSNRDPRRRYAKGGLVDPLYLAGGGSPLELLGGGNTGVFWRDKWALASSATDRHDWPLPQGTDTIPAMLSPNEYVMPTDTVIREGAAAFDALRAGAATIVPTGPLAGASFDSGGANLRPPVIPEVNGLTVSPAFTAITSGGRGLGSAGPASRGLGSAGDRSSMTVNQNISIDASGVTDPALLARLLGREIVRTAEFASEFHLQATTNSNGVGTTIRRVVR